MVHFIIPAVVLAAIKAYFWAHGRSITLAAIEAGYKAYRKDEDVVEAAMKAGADRASACLLVDAIFSAF